MSRLRQENGWAVITALVMMLIIAGFGTATLTLAGQQQRESGAERQRETGFNLAEAAMNAQIFSLARHWAGTGGAAGVVDPRTGLPVAYPSSCTQATASDLRCPDAATIQKLFTSPDTTPNSVWTTMVRDNSGLAGSATYWSETMITASPTYDANGDGTLWVRAQATVQGRGRTLVALVRSEAQQEPIPRGTVIAGKLAISNNGNKTIIDTLGANSASPGDVIVRCDPVAQPSATCLGHPYSGGVPPARNNVQISPNVSVSRPTQPSALTSDSLSRMQDAAVANGTYYTTCPASLTGAVVYIDVPAGTNCGYSGNGNYNTVSAPGVVIVARGSISLNGTSDFYGLLYAANLSGSSADLISLGGNAAIYGGVMTDGNAGVVAGSSKFNIVFDPRAFAAVQSRGSAGLIQNTWRELTGQTG